MRIGEKNGSSLVELGSIISDLSALKEMAEKMPPDKLLEVLPSEEQLAQLSETVGHLLFLHQWKKGMDLTEKYRKKEPQAEKRCTCRCHTFGEKCAGFGSGDNNCCTKPHEKYPEWATRIDPVKKKKLLELFREQAKQVSGERGVVHWISDMDIPEHVKSVLQGEINTIGLICANCSYEFDVKDSIDWVLKTLEKFL